MIKTNSNVKQKEYWTNRNEKLFLANEKPILEYANDLKKTYRQAIQNINNEIYKFYGKYATENQMSMAELNKLLRTDELKSFKESIDDITNYVKEHNLDPDFEKQLKILRLRSRISRLEELKTNIQFEVEKLTNNVSEGMHDELYNTFEDGYYETVFNQQKFLGFSTAFAGLNDKLIEKAIKTPYMTENYSDVIWKNKQKLLNVLNKQIPQGLILGYNPKKVADIATKQLDINYNSAVRLVRTEYNLLLNDASSQGYRAAGIEKYEILATLDSRTSEICREMDGEIIPLKDKQVGINFPPFHPNCRTTTIPYFEPDEFDVEIERYIKDKNGYKHKIENDTTYKEWKNALKKNNDGTYIYNNSLYRNR